MADTNNLEIALNIQDEQATRDGFGCTLRADYSSTTYSREIHAKMKTMFIEYCEQKNFSKPR